MAKLTTARRKRLPSSKFALPKQDGYPVDTKARANNAKARATQQYEKGNLSFAELQKVHRKANRALKEKGVEKPTPVPKSPADLKRRKK